MPEMYVRSTHKCQDGLVPRLVSAGPEVRSARSEQNQLLFGHFAFTQFVRLPALHIPCIRGLRFATRSLGVNSDRFRRSLFLAVACSSFAFASIGGGRRSAGVLGARYISCPIAALLANRD